MNKLIFKDKKSIYRVSITQKLMIQIQKLCHSALPNETGGILIGYYTDECNLAVITKIIKAPSDSKSGPTWFYRGTYGIKQKLDALWKDKKQFYIGEWHYHPNSSSKLSYQDIKQMTSIANSPSYSCPEPILLIVGGDFLSWEKSVYVFPKGRDYIYLK
ncbi:Mov34/MPN/PAD-1 family protein [Priestia megaterium]|uniref:Mov34/MPN/PAD-1 family protein n=1 Tax=Priestia megaterium TaxID=1404 RepID=UPI001A94B9A8|nr:Mov34/MPN/PAD-1 family protein [Priestia megaterium]QSX23902.1 Mov34/MPN/PAD-1 family protein [Priestia megaterium]